MASGMALASEVTFQLSVHSPSAEVVSAKNGDSRVPSEPPWNMTICPNSCQPVAVMPEVAVSLDSRKPHWPVEEEA